MEVQLEFAQSSSSGPFQQISWYKGGRVSLSKRLAFVDPTLTRGQTWYYNEYCSTTSPCDMSIKGELDTDTGAFIIYNVQLTDEDFYYYSFVHPISGAGDTILKYEVNLKVYGKCFW